MLNCLKHYKSKNTKVTEDMYASIIEYIIVMDRFIDVVNGNREKDCELIDEKNHRRVFELLDVVHFLRSGRMKPGRINTTSCRSPRFRILCGLLRVLLVLLIHD